MAKTTRGFSLVELLVTIAIIAIIAAILLPLLATAKMHAEQTHCVANLRQLEMVSMMYKTDNGRQLGYVYPSFPGGSSWTTSLEINTNQYSIGTCPAARLADDFPKSGFAQGNADQAWVSWTKNKKTMFTSSYGFNSWFYSQVRDTGWSSLYAPLFYTGEGDVNNTSATPIFTDSTWMDGAPMEKNQPYHDLYTGSPLDTWGDDMGRLTISRHGGVLPKEVPRNLQRGQRMPGGINAVMADGHAQLVPLENLWKLTWHRGWVIPAERPDKPK